MINVATRIVGVLLAAGRGTRFDPSGARLKLLEAAARGPHTGTPLAAAAARTLCADMDEVVAVGAPAIDEPTRRLHDCLQAEGCRAVVNPRAVEGQATSIAAGIAATPGADGWIIALADMPAIPLGAPGQVVRALRAGALTVAPVCRGQGGHPVGFAAELREELLALTGDTGARTVLAMHPPQLLGVDDPGVLYDVDFPKED